MLNFSRDKLYLVYDSKIETEDSLNLLLNKVIKSAGFDLSLIKTIPVETVEEMIENNILPTYLICINQTFKDLNAIYSDRLEVPIYEFFSKEYSNESLGIIMTGILLDVNSIFEDAYKRYSWNVIKKFKIGFDEIFDKFNTNKTQETSTIQKEIIEDPSEITEIPSYLNMNVEEKEDETVKEEVTTPVKPSHTVDENTVNLLNNIKLLFNLLETIKKDIKTFETKI